MRKAVSEYADGVQSLNELDFTTWCRSFGLPEPIRQSRVLDSTGRLRAVDVEFRTNSGASLRLEIEGLHHLDPAQHFADISRPQRPGRGPSGDFDARDDVAHSP